MTRSGKPTNLYLNSSLKKDAVEVARERYNLSLSQLVERLLRQELAMKKGLLNRRAA